MGAMVRRISDIEENLKLSVGLVYSYVCGLV